MDKSKTISFLKEYSDLEGGILDLDVINRSSLKKLLNKTQRSISVKEKDSFHLSLDILNAKLVNPFFKSQRDPKILFENDSLIFLHKPHEVHNLPLKYHEQDNLLSFLRERNKLGMNLSEWSDLGLVNRLDFKTSGIVVYSKSKDLKKSILNNRDAYFIEKKYLAITIGKCESMSIAKKILAYGKNGAQMVVRDDGVPARIDCKLIEFNKEKNLSLIEVKLYEGHRHQIRVLLQSNHTPILGDSLYGEKTGSERMYLHHSFLKFSLNQEVIEVFDKGIDEFRKNFQAFEL